MSYQPARRERTLAVTILAILAAIAGVLALLDAARYMGWLPIATLGEMNFVLPSAEWFAALMSAIVGIIWFVVAWWLWTLNPSGWLFVVVIAIINLIFLFLAILGKTTFSAVALQVIVNAAALILALLPGTKAAFRPTLPSAEQLRAAQAQAKTAAASAKTAAVSASAAAAAVAPKPAPTPAVDDLTRIEGVGPKTADALNAAGVTSYPQLAAMTPDQIGAILSKAHISSDPDSWPKQAALAAAGQWAELKSYQDTLEGGRAV